MMMIKRPNKIELHVQIDKEVIIHPLAIHLFEVSIFKFFICLQ